jgi:hypothetical protein
MTQNQKYEISKLEKKAQFELDQDEKEFIKGYIAEKREYQRLLAQKASGTCGQLVYPRIHLNSYISYGYHLKFNIILFDNYGLGKGLNFDITPHEAEDLIEKLKAYLEIVNAQASIDKVQYKIQ